MIKAHLDLTRNDVLLATLTWHKIDETGAMLDIGYDWTDAIDDDTKKRVQEVCAAPIRLTGAGGERTGTAYPGSSKHFEALPKHLERLGCRVRSYY
jgi:hypothetical protein